MTPPEGSGILGRREDIDQRQLASIRHDLRTPINHIIGYSEMLQEDVSDLSNCDVLPDLQKIHQGGKQLLVLINQFFDPEQFKSKQWDTAEVLHELRTPVNHIIGYSELLQDELTERGYERLVPDLQKIHSAATRWLGLMETYLVPKEGADPFQPLVAAPSAEGSPVFDAETALTPFVPRSANASTPAEGSLLVVDDDATNREMLGRRLQRQGYTIATAENGQQALDLIRKGGKFDLILLDMIMPGIDGFQVLQQLKADVSFRHIPVLMISALDDIDGIVRCIEIGAEDYLSKPFNPVFLRARIGASLEKKRLRDQEQVYLKRIQEEQEKSERLLLNILPMPIAERLKQGESNVVDNFADVTVLFADLVGFTSLSANIPSDRMVGLLNEIFSSFDALAGTHGLEKIKTIGDAYMAVSGLPNPRDDHAQAAANMALDLQNALAQFNATYQLALQMRIGMNTGPVIAGIIGSKKFIYDLWGDTVNMASRMESHGQPGFIQVTETTYERLQHGYLFDHRGMIEVKGKGRMPAYWLIGKHPPA